VAITMVCSFCRIDRFLYEGISTLPGRPSVMSKHDQSESFRTELHVGAMGNRQVHSVALVPHDLS
jgi:hypothetical protein